MALIERVMPHLSERSDDLRQVRVEEISVADRDVERDVDDDVDRDAPPVVVAAVAAGSVPVPFLAVYAVMFIIHGKFHPVVPPDITDTQHGEFVAGIIALVLFAVSFIAVIWMLNGTRRWLFVLVQLAVLAGAIDFVVDKTRGGVGTAVVIGAAAVVALVLALLPQAHAYIHGSRRRRRRVVAADPAEPSERSGTSAR